MSSSTLEPFISLDNSTTNLCHCQKLEYLYPFILFYESVILWNRKMSLHTVPMRLVAAATIIFFEFLVRLLLEWVPFKDF